MRKKFAKMILLLVSTATLLTGSTAAFASDYEFKITVSDDGYNSAASNKKIDKSRARVSVDEVNKVNIWGTKGAPTDAVTNFIVIAADGAQITSNTTVSKGQVSYMNYYTAAHSGVVYLRANSTVEKPKYIVSGTWDPNI